MPAQDGTYQSSYGQNFQTGIYTPAGNTGRPDFAYQKYYDDTNNLWRGFRNKAEAHAWIPTPKVGQFRIIRIGYSALTNGVYTGGVDTVYIYLGGIAVDNLVELKVGGGTLVHIAFLEQQPDITSLDFPYVPDNSFLQLFREGVLLGEAAFTTGGTASFSAANPPSSGLNRYDGYYYPSTTAWVPSTVGAIYPLTYNTQPFYS